jgi:hypothetical protein
MNKALTKVPTKAKQRKFIQLWLGSNSDTFGDAYHSAIVAGFSPSYARVITTDAIGSKWIQEAKLMYAQALTPEHIYRGIQDIALKTRADRDKLRAFELLGKFNGMFIDRVQSEVSVKFTNDVPRPVIDQEGN